MIVSCFKDHFEQSSYLYALKKQNKTKNKYKNKTKQKT